MPGDLFSCSAHEQLARAETFCSNSLVPVPEFTAQPNDPALYDQLIAVMNETTEDQGVPFFFAFTPKPDAANATYYLNNYPTEPEELYGVAGVMTDFNIINQEARRVPGVSALVQA